MLPRNLRSIVAANRVSQYARTLHRQQHLLRPPPRVASAAQFHSSARRRDEVPKSPFQAFKEVLDEEIKKNRELQDNVKQLEGDVGKLKDSEAMKRAQQMYEQALLRASIRENPRLRALAKQLSDTGHSVEEAVSKALKESEILRAVSRASAAVSEKVASTTEPLRNTAAYKSLAETIVDALDDSGSAKHAGFEEKEARRRRRQIRLAKAGKTGGLGPAARRTEANPEAGQSVVLHKDSPRQEKWNQMIESNPLLRQLKAMRTAFDESENPVVSSLRSVVQGVASVFDENETAQVTRLMKALDPAFNREAFERELREYIVPEVVDAFLSADREGLQAWCGEAAFNVLWATMEQYLRQGLVSDSKVLDIRQVDVLQGKLLEHDRPVWVVTFATQEVLLFRNAKTGEVVVGAETRVEQCTYAAVLTRVEEELADELTGGWKVLELMRRSARAYL